jgi:hypothetical protein
MSLRARSFLITLTPLLALAACDAPDGETHASVARAVEATDVDGGTFDAAVPPAPVEVPAPPYAVPTGQITGGPNGDCDIEGPVLCEVTHQGRTLTGGIAVSFTLQSAYWQPGTPSLPLDTTKNVDWRGFDFRVGGRRLLSGELKGLSFPIAGTTGFFTVRQAFTDNAQHGRYLVGYSTNGGPLVPLCAANDTAYVIPGNIFSSIYHDSSTTASFVCHNSAAGKAVAFGYSPRGFLGAIQGNFFLAATRMARADYCGSNMTRTVDGTNLMFYDLDGLVNRADRTPTAPPSPRDVLPYYFEAAWRDGLRTTVLCMSKLRWQILPPRNFCGLRLPDPRLYHDHETQFCEDLGQFSTAGSFTHGLQILRNKGALVFSSSQFNDIGLWIWHSGLSTITTTRGFWGGASGGSYPPVPDAGYENDTPTYVSSILTADVPGKTKPLRLYFNPTTLTYRSSTSPPSTWCTDPGCQPNSWTAVPDEEGGLVGYVYTDGNLPTGLAGVALRVWATTPLGTDIESTRFILLPQGVDGTAPFIFDHNRTEGYGLVESLAGN